MRVSVREVIVDRFPNLVYTMGEAKGFCDIPPIDIRDSVGWGLLDEQEKGNLVDMGLQYLQRLNVEVGLNDVAICCAVKLSYLQKKDFESFGLKKVGLRRLFSILVKNEHFWSGDDDIVKIVNELHSKVAGCHANLVDIIVDKCHNGLINPLSIFSQLLSPIDANEILTRLHVNPPSDLDFSRIVKILSKVGEYANVYMSKLFVWSSKKPPRVEQANMLKVALELSPIIRMKSILRWIKSDATWGKQWLEAALRCHQAEEFVGFILNCQPSQIATFLIFLDKAYPDSLAGRHNKELVYSSDGVDEAYELKLYLINSLVKCDDDKGVKVLRRVARGVRTKKWVQIVRDAECVRRIALEKERELRLPPIKLEELKYFLQPENYNKALIHTSESLRRYLQGVLDEFNKWLRSGVKTKNAVRLWRRIQKGRAYYWQNKDELSLSDEINNFINKKAMSLSTFREPFVSFYEENGKRHRGFADLIVHVQDPFGVRAPAEVIIEVKGNWNREVKTGLEKQLVDHYLKNLGRESHGIFVCGCFNRKKVVKGYRNKEDAQKNLKEQYRKLRKPWKVRVGVSVLDCSLEGVPNDKILS